MKRQGKPPAARGGRAGPDSIAAYARAQSPAHRELCRLLREMIDAALPDAASRVWHGSPVWFSDENPVVGYNVSKRGVNLLFWNGQAIDKESLEPVGKYGAAQAVFGAAGEVDRKLVRRWLQLAKDNVFDSRSFFKKLREAKAKPRAGSR